ncbi:hypothetical protein GCM10017083_49530 [Thalassobaculum fulvum]|uniref:Uncharacterized protein n=1 Tax=Thalassobaculum fulvum TaxID=1633335 RepID=A0A919CTJ9_9PROT|nr:hypothetical protein GCM10017083_49530 [Thalassobaculum fulvum]
MSVRQLVVDEGAQADLIEIRRSDQRAAAAILTALQEASSGPDGLESLTIDGFENDWYEVSYVRFFGKEGLNVWRLKEGFLEEGWRAYRVVYGVDYARESIIILAVVSRDWNYDKSETDPQSARIRAAYERHGISNIPRG